jgi:hypothetical protein
MSIAARVSSLRIAWMVERAKRLGEAGDAASARDLLLVALPRASRAFGANDHVTLAVRAHLAHWTAKAGDLATARDEYAALMPVSERAYGPEDPETLATRRELACLTGDAGDAASALVQT